MGLAERRAHLRQTKRKRRRERVGSWRLLLTPGPSANPPVFQEELGDVKAVSAPAASPIRCETSRERDRISVLPRCNSRPPETGEDPCLALPDRTKHTG